MDKVKKIFFVKPESVVLAMSLKEQADYTADYLAAIADPHTEVVQFQAGMAESVAAPFETVKVTPPGPRTDAPPMVLPAPDLYPNVPSYDDEIEYCGNCESSMCMACGVCHTCGGGGVGKEYLAEPPWVERGITVEVSHITPTWRKSGQQEWKYACKSWGVDLTIDPVQSMADFYLLDGIAGMVFNGFAEVSSDPECRIIAKEAAEIQRDLISRLDRTFRSYVDMVIGGEVRYHPAVGKNFHSGRSTAWLQWHEVRSKVGPQALLDAALLFRNYVEAGGGGSVAGENWAVAAELLHARITGKLTPRDWVDRVFTLEHNGGCLLNKVAWAQKTRTNWDVSAMRVFIGPAHAANPPGYGVLLAACSDQVLSLFNRWWMATNKAGRVLGRRPVQLPTWRTGTVYDKPPSSERRKVPTRTYRWAGEGYFAQAMMSFTPLDSPMDYSLPEFSTREWAWLRAWGVYQSQMGRTDFKVSHEELISLIKKLLHRAITNDGTPAQVAYRAAPYMNQFWKFVVERGFKPPKNYRIEAQVREAMYLDTGSSVYIPKSAKMKPSTKVKFKKAPGSDSPPASYGISTQKIEAAFEKWKKNFQEGADDGS